MMHVLRWPLRVVKWGLDACAGILVCLVACVLARRNKSAATGQVHALFIVPGANVESIYRKFGTLDVYFSDNPDFFHKVERLLLGRGNFTLHLKDNFIVTERNTDNTRFPLLGHARILLAAIRIARLEPVSIIHARSPYQPGLIGVAASWLLGAPLCISIHSDYEKREALQAGTIPRILGSVWLSRRAERFCYAHATRVLPIRESMVPHIEGVGCPPSKIRLWPHGVNLTAFTLPAEESVRDHFGLPEDARIISSVGRLVDENYAYDLLDICKAVVAMRPDTYCLICGTGEREESMRQAVQQAGLGERILLPGNVPLKLSYEIRKQSDVNLSLMGGFSLIEACAGGKPAIAYDVEWHYELVKNDETGLLAPEHAVDLVIERIIHYLDNPQLAALHGEAGKALAFARHDSRIVKQHRAAVYQEVLDEYR
ncbi:MAG: glycosyltransferase [Pseudomonadota bacterium]